MKKFNYSKLYLKLFILFLLVLLTFFFLQKKFEYKISGKIFGTVYNIKAIVPIFKNKTKLRKSIQRELSSLNKTFSVFEKTSEINEFNYNLIKNKPFFPSSDFMTVMKIAEKIYSVTEGSWDPTISPLINLWGFGTKKKEDGLAPKKEEIEKALKKSGFKHITIKDSYILKKEDITLNLSSIAKGYAVDKLAIKLKEEKIKNFIVEIGGEVYASGEKNRNKKWVVGINMPKKTATINAVEKALYLKDMAMATSGNYRNFYKVGNKYYTHIIDPKNGYPVSNKIVSVSVLHKSCAVADGIATAIMVTGKDRGLKLAEKLSGVEVFIIEEQNNKLKEYVTSNFFKQAANSL